MAATDIVRASRLPASGWLESLLSRLGISGRTLVIAIPFLWLLLYFFLPFLIVLKVSLAFIAIAQPPYTHYDAAGNFVLNIGDSYGRLVKDALYIKAYLNSLMVAAISTLLCLFIGYPFAYGMARCHRSVRNILLMLVILPFWTSFLIRVYAWIGLLKNNGLINEFLMWLGLIDSPIGMMNTNFAVYLGIVYSYLPFMILPLYANLEKMDMSLIEAATDLGCKPLKAFFLITVPLSFPGIVAGSMLVFIPAVGEYVIPELLGGPSSLMIGRILWGEFFSNRDWPTASAVAIAILLALVVPLMFYQKYQDKEMAKES
ncbi:ABC transporter permease subunit [Dongia deserti]|uniref:ABC transporter permease subunit n=1 Tax=Dongia deserti TaxID=2268030 RepID=UPI000E64822D|nr:ABC transporter permease subunit [Dongia deserti]